MGKKNTSSDKPRHSEAYLIEKEKQKTQRMRNMYIFFGVITLAGIIAIYLLVMKSGGKGGIDVNLSEGSFKFSIDKPVVTQAETETKTYRTPGGKSIDYTTGRVSKQVLDDFSDDNVSFSPNYFVGENLVNEVAGYIISSSYPAAWNVQYNPAGLNDPLTPINTLMASDGSHLNVGREDIAYEYVEDYINAAIQVLFDYDVITEFPYVSYADDGKTAFLTFTNYETNGQSYMKVVQGRSFYYIATANYNLDYTDIDTQDELIWMVANFTLIE